MQVASLIRLARPQHWIKNLIVFFPVLFAMRARDAGSWRQAAIATAAFCLASSAVYVLNDIFDREKDRFHPRKCNRPLAAGKLSVTSAVVFALVLAAGALAVAAAGRLSVVALVAGYLALMTVYSLALKNRMLLDVICIAMGFVLRAVAGALAIGVPVSPWLFVCTFTTCLFMGFCKRSNELATIDDSDQARAHRFTLAGYTPRLLTPLLTLSAAVAVVGFLLYASVASATRPRGAEDLVYTLPIVIYAVFRFAMLSMQGRYAGPTDLILRDRAVQLTIALWLGIVAVLLLWPGEVRAWLTSAAR